MAEGVAIRIANIELFERNLEHHHYIYESGFQHPPFPQWTYQKHSQWNIFPIEFIDYMQRDWKTFETFAWAEFHIVPDEHFFGSRKCCLPQL
jgi:hypothetical protein